MSEIRYVHGGKGGRGGKGGDGGSGGSAGCGGCLGCLLPIIIIWAIVFGVSWGGTHYAVGCNTDDGVHITEER